MVREIKKEDLPELLKLYLHLHETKVPEISDEMRSVWQQILLDQNHHIIVAEEEGALVSSCVCVVILNLTRNSKPYALVENVVTLEKYRNRGLATACLNYARALSKEAGCYKMMLLTGSKEKKTLEFYKQAGYNSDDKTAFIQWL